ncbi:alpha-tocopherol transfer protein-like [Anastrepha obliqua]|uniref:alpha-tocopherol transfer protein-like n=1 Tax=Anastrepha obliqua TaxID=95512 RepID=UPI002409B5DE|nr:alpha-tocopherol transfer protein-like [Anastrepha obliqua]XP_054738287.1 alpha-tocopherol transfer protein-like [Anastrepha obliqua]
MNPLSDNIPPVIRPLSPALQKIAGEELNEVPSRVADDVLALRQWIHKQPHLCARTNDQFLVGFLRGSKHSLEKAKQKIDRYYTLKAALPEIFNERRQVDDPLVLEIVRLGVILQISLPEDYPGPCITIIRACSYDTTKYKFADIIRVGSMFGEIMTIEDDNSTVSGYIEVMDMNNVSGQHFLQLKPDLLRKFSTFAEEAMPLRQRGTHFINVPTPFEKGFKTLSTFFSEKMLSRISVNSSPEALFDFVPREYLPQEYGGENGTIEDIIERMEAKLLRYRDHFLLEPQFGTNEKLREGAPFSYENCFGLEGSFRKLEVD